jgi:hypothetical protein
MDYILVAVHIVRIVHNLVERKLVGRILDTGRIVDNIADNIEHMPLVNTLGPGHRPFAYPLLSKYLPD